MSSKTYTSSIIICVIAYIVAAFAAYIVVGLLPQGLSLLWKAAIADIAATIAVYAFSISFKNSSLYDPYWSVIPPAIAAYWFLPNGISNAEWLTLAVILFWAIRLTLNWAKGWEGLKHQDWRYVMLEKKNPAIYWLTNFGGIHMFPTIMVFMGMVPVYYLSVETVAINPLIIIGGLISVAATLIEWIADEQMHTFKKTAEKGTFIDSGLWRYSRHPNYFGEITFWLGLWVMAMGVDTAYWWTAFGWIAMLLMFLFASIPMMEEKNRNSKPGYKEYISRVSVLIPWFRKQ